MAKSKTIKGERLEIRIVLLGSLLLWALPMSWIPQALVFVVIAVILCDIVWRGEETAHLNKLFRVSLSLLIVCAVAFIAYSAVEKQYKKEIKSSEDLRVTFDFPDGAETGKINATFNSTFFNAGENPVEIKELSVLLAGGIDLTRNAGMHADYCDFDDTQFGFAHFFLQNRNVGKPQKLTIPGKDGILYYHFLSKHGTINIQKNDVQTVSADIEGYVSHPEFNVWAFCPVIDYYDSRGDEKTVICRGYTVANLERIPEAGYGGYIFGPGANGARRLLPHDQFVDCKVTDETH